MEVAPRGMDYRAAALPARMSAFSFPGTPRWPLTFDVWKFWLQQIIFDLVLRISPRKGMKNYDNLAATSREQKEIQHFRGVLCAEPGVMTLLNMCLRTEEKRRVYSKTAPKQSTHPTHDLLLHLVHHPAHARLLAPIAGPRAGPECLGADILPGPAPGLSPGGTHYSGVERGTAHVPVAVAKPVEVVLPSAWRCFKQLCRAGSRPGPLAVGSVSSPDLIRKA
jgi:hypothetical protein